MRRPSSRPSLRPRSSRLLVRLVLALAIAAALAACAPAEPADGPVSTVNQAIDLAAKKDLDGLRGLACAGQEDMIKDQLGLSGSLADVAAGMLPGLDVQKLLGAVSVDVKKLKAGKAAIDGDTAEVPVSGSVKVTFDKATMGPLLKQVLAANGTTMTDDQLNALLDSMEAYGQDFPVDQTVRLVRENGAWRICQDTLASPSPR